jgi:hypothetical protein
LSTRSLRFLSTSCKEVPSWVLTATSILEVCRLCSVMCLGDSSIWVSSAPSCSQQTSHMNVLLYPLLVDVWFYVDVVSSLDGVSYMGLVAMHIAPCICACHITQGIGRTALPVFVK